MPQRRFPPTWSAEERDVSAYRVDVAHDEADVAAAKLLMRDETRRIATTLANSRTRLCRQHDSRSPPQMQS